jgi:rfaE bifunctional protein kinase chain/domain
MFNVVNLKSYTSSHIESLFRKIRKLKIFVIGDAMLDCYWHGEVNRVSPEAPVPVLEINRKEEKLGGAANVALNCRALGAEVHLFTIIGKDDSGKTMIRLLQQEGIHTEPILVSAHRKTTTKTRLSARYQQVMRLDEEVTSPIKTKEEHQFIDTCLRAIQIDEPDIIIFEDYNKGILLPNVISKIVQHARLFNCLIAVDPKRQHFFSYNKVDIFKPNLKEVREALPALTILPEKKSLEAVHKAFQQEIKNRITLITLSEQGIFCKQEKDTLLLPAHRRQIADVSGAGDTVISVFSMLYRVSNDLHLSTEAANLAGGLVCEEVGVHPVNKQKLVNELLRS